MVITQLDSILYTNQNMHVAASKQIDLQGRIDFQNIVAAAAANDKTREIAETRPTEEGKGIDSDREHNKERAEEEAGEKAEEIRMKFNKKDKNEDDIPTTNLLDIKA